MNTSAHEIRRVVLNNPSELSYLFKSPNEDKPRLTKIISKLVPFKVGVEFELFGSLAESLLGQCRKVEYIPSLNNEDLSYARDKFDKKLVDSKLARMLNIVSYSEDYYDWTLARETNGSLNEIRICFNGYHQLKSFERCCSLLNKYCKIPAEKGGIHIHIDFTKVIKDKGEDAAKYAVSFFNDPNILSRVLQIFGGYKGKYNSRIAKRRSKGGWINVSILDTIEFRIGHLTYNYHTIISWIVELSKLVQQCKDEIYNGVERKIDEVNSFDETQLMDTTISDSNGNEYCEESDPDASIDFNQITISRINSVADSLSTISRITNNGYYESNSMPWQI